MGKLRMSISIKPEICQWSGFKIHPGRGKTLVRTNSQTFVLISKKVEAQFKNKTNPRKCPWTKIFRTVNKKGIQEEKKRKRVRKQKKVIKAVVGLSVEDIKRKKKDETKEKVKGKGGRKQNNKNQPNKIKNKKGSGKGR